LDPKKLDRFTFKKKNIGRPCSSSAHLAHRHDEHASRAGESLLHGRAVIEKRDRVLEAQQPRRIRRHHLARRVTDDLTDVPKKENLRRVCVWDPRDYAMEAGMINAW
jgi:hypothetical protein